MTKGFRFYFDKDIEYLISEETKLFGDYFAPRRAKSRLRMYANLFTRDLRKTLLNSESVCKHCNSKENLQLDHIIPIAKKGKNEISNIQILCANCNLKKKHY